MSYYSWIIISPWRVKAVVRAFLVFGTLGGRADTTRSVVPCYTDVHTVTPVHNVLVRTGHNLLDVIIREIPVVGWVSLFLSQPSRLGRRTLVVEPFFFPLLNPPSRHPLVTCPLVDNVVQLYLLFTHAPIRSLNESQGERLVLLWQAFFV